MGEIAWQYRPSHRPAPKMLTRFKAEYCPIAFGIEKSEQEECRLRIYHRVTHEHTDSVFGGIPTSCDVLCANHVALTVTTGELTWKCAHEFTFLWTLCGKRS